MSHMMSGNLRLFPAVNLARILSDGAAAHGDRPALWFEGRPISYAELERRASVGARVLRDRGVGTGDRVVIRLPNAPAFVAACFGALRVGAIVVPLNVLLAPPEIKERIAASSPAAVVEDALPTEGVGEGEIAERDSDDPAVVLFTSGTSGRPKGAILTHGGTLAAARNAADALTLGPEDAALVVRRLRATVTTDELQAWTKERVAAYKYPRRIVFVDDLPKGPTGKILKRAIDLGGLPPAGS